MVIHPDRGIMIHFAAPGLGDIEGHRWQRQEIGLLRLEKLINLLLVFSGLLRP